MLKESMETTKADLWYVVEYAHKMEAQLMRGAVFLKREQELIKKAHEMIIEAYAATRGR